MLALALAALPYARAGQPRPSAPPDPLAMPSDFPPADQRVWSLQLNGLVAKAAAEALRRAPDAPETLDLLQRANRLDDAIAVLETIADGRLANLERALTFAPALVSSATMNDITGRAARLREIVGRAKTRVPELPRDEAARVARALLGIDGSLCARSSRSGRAPTPRS
jgi:hypothetical protein